jgi:hypothetical protein
MAFLGGLGKSLGFGSTQQIVQDLTGSRVAGAVAGQAAKGLSTLTRFDRAQQGQATAVSVPQAPPSETAFSGEAVQPRTAPMQAQPMSYMAGIQPASFRRAPAAPGGMATPAGLPAIIAGGTSVARTVGGMLGLAGGAIMVAPIIIDPLTGEEKKLRVTRRLKSQVKKAVEMFGIEFVAEQMGVDVEVIVYIMTKRMRNDGPYVTKAAVRKTRQTVRKMKNLCDMYDDLRPAARRRAPARKTMSTRITNVK